MQTNPLILASVAALFLARGAEAFSQSAGEKLGAKVGELCQAVADKFLGDSDAEETLALAQKRPDSKGRLSALEEVLAEKLDADPDFAARVQRLIDELEKSGGGRTAFDQRGQTVHGTQTNIAGNVRSPVFSGQFNGPVALGGEAVDMRGSPGAMNKTSGSVSQYFGDVYKNYFQQTEKFPVPHQIPPSPRNFTGREDPISEIIGPSLNCAVNVLHKIFLRAFVPWW